MARLKAFATSFLPYALASTAFFFFAQTLNHFQLQEQAFKYLSHAASHKYTFFSIIAVSAFIETVAVASLYFPGSVILALSAVAAKSNIDLLALVAVAANVGICAGLLFNLRLALFLRKYWPGLDNNYVITTARNQFVKYGRIWVAAAAWHPNWIGATYAAIGLMQISVRPYLCTTVLALNFFIFLYLTFSELAATQLHITATNHHYFISGAVLLFGLIVSAHRSIKSPKQ